MSTQDIAFAIIIGIFISILVSIIITFIGDIISKYFINKRKKFTDKILLKDLKTKIRRNENGGPM